MTAPSIVALADAQFGISAVLRPFVDFETLYQGQPSTTPIMVSQVLKQAGGQALDELAAEGTSGYDPLLLRGLAVPLGARILIYLPKMGSVSTPTRYNWNIYWRLRNVGDFRRSRVYPYHLGKQGAGVPDTTTTSTARVVIPCADQTIIFNETEPTGDGDVAINNARSESISVNPLATPTYSLPLLPSGLRGVFQQGIQDPGASTQAVAGLPGYQLHEVQAEGDELLIGFWRAAGSSATWDFAAAAVDESVSTILGSVSTPNVGVYVSAGAAP